MDVAMTHESAAPRKHPVVLENGVLTSRLREDYPGIEVDQVRVRSRPRRRGAHHVVNTMRIVTSGTRRARSQMSAVPPLRCLHALTETRVRQDAGAVVTAVAQRVVVKAFRRAVRRLVAFLQNRTKGRTVRAS